MGQVSDGSNRTTLPHGSRRMVWSQVVVVVCDWVHHDMVPRCGDEREDQLAFHPYFRLPIVVSRVNGAVCMTAQSRGT